MKKQKRKNITLFNRLTTSVFCGFFSLVLLSGLSSCGTETGNPVIKRPTTPRNIAQDSVESDLLETTESLSDFNSTSASLHLALGTATDVTSVDINECTGESTKASVKMERTRERTKTLGKKGGSISLLLERKLTTDWVSPNGGLECVGNTLKKTLRLMKGATETRKGTVLRSLVRNTQGGTLASKEYSSAKFNSSGEWKTSFDNIEVLSDTVVLSRTSSWSLKKSLLTTTSEGEAAIESSNETSRSAPLMVKIERYRATGAIKQRTIDSGTIKTTRSDGTVVEISYEAVIFSETDTCYPSKGKMRGLVTPASSNGSNSESFEIDFSAPFTDAPEIKFVDGTTVPLSGACVD
ncbi:MAG: hypothetical protein RI953_1521 [Pseudomonadota bacterium]|jgi:hypothetical protein